MKRFLLLLLPMSLSSAALFAQKGRVSVSVADTTVIPELLLPGSSAASLAEYSPKAASGHGEFLFEYARVGSLGVCRYRIICKDGIVTAVDLASRAQSVPKSLETTLQQRYGQAALENVEKREGQVIRQTLQFRQGGQSARLDIQNNIAWMFNATQG